MSKTSYAEKISDCEVMISGLTKNQEQLSNRGIDAAFISELTTLKEEAVTLNNDQESLKAQQKRKTEELLEKMEAMCAKLSEARKLVKLDVRPALWKECGINDKR
ncbi:MAG: hypothetical protein GY950_35470 [bacterium]|nr:hypothetical protein [bacterium]